MMLALLLAGGRQVHPQCPNTAPLASAARELLQGEPEAAAQILVPHWQGPHNVSKNSLAKLRTTSEWRTFRGGATVACANGK